MAGEEDLSVGVRLLLLCGHDRNALVQDGALRARELREQVAAQIRDLPEIVLRGLGDAVVDDKALQLSRHPLGKKVEKLSHVAGSPLGRSKDFPVQESRAGDVLQLESVRRLARTSLVELSQDPDRVPGFFNREKRLGKRDDVSGFEMREDFVEVERGLLEDPARLSVRPERPDLHVVVEHRIVPVEAGERLARPVQRPGRRISVEAGARPRTVAASDEAGEPGNRLDVLLHSEPLVIRRRQVHIQAVEHERGGSRRSRRRGAPGPPGWLLLQLVPDEDESGPVVDDAHYFG